MGFFLFQEEINCYGRFRGIILRSQLIVLLQNKIFNEYCEHWGEALSIKMFRDEYPRYPTIELVNITPDEKTYTMDLRPFMNPSPYTLQHVSTFILSFKHITQITTVERVLRPRKVYANGPINFISTLLPASCIRSDRMGTRSLESYSSNAQQAD